MNQSRKKNQLIIMSKQKALSDLAKEIRPTDACYYLNDDYLTLVRIKKTLSPEYEISLCGRRFHEVITEIQEDFLRMCHEINIKNKYDIYWGTHLASRNSESVPVFKNIVYLICAEEILRNAKSRIILICDSLALAKTIKSAAEKQEFSCHIKLTSCDVFQPVRLYMRIALRGSHFLFISFMQWFYARMLKNERITQRSGSPVCILRSWVTDGSINAKGIYNDRNFGELQDYMTMNGKDVWILPMFFNLDRSIFAQMKLMAKSQKRFIFQEQYLTGLDLLMALRDGLKSIFIIIGKIELNGRDVSAIIKEAHLSTCLSVELLLLNSVKYLIKNFKRGGLIIERFIYPLENNPPEKTFIIAARKWYPDSKIIGFQHTTFFPNQLAYHLSPGEKDYHPLPDKIVCSGPIYIDLLKRAGFPSGILVEGPNLRFDSVYRTNGSLREASDVRKNLLLPLPGLPDRVFEILVKVNEALRATRDYKVYIRTHPVLSKKTLAAFLQKIGTKDYKFADDGIIQEWLPKMHATISAGASITILESVCMGIPVIRVAPDNSVFYDPFIWPDYPLKPVHTGMEIKEQLQMIDKIQHEDRLIFKKIGEHVLTEYFTKPDEENLKVFL